MLHLNTFGEKTFRKQKCDVLTLSDYELCVNHLKSLQRKFLKEPELIRKYNQIIEEQLSKGIVERVAAEKDNERENVHYLPHHAVKGRDRETTKLRIVYDGLAKPPERTHSFNDCLETGPNYTSQLVDTQINFRCYAGYLVGSPRGRVGGTPDNGKFFFFQQWSNHAHEYNQSDSGLAFLLGKQHTLVRKNT